MTLVFVSILMVYYLPGILKDLWMVALLILYFRSKDEPFWLAFFLVTVDGFMGFLGLYSCTLKIFPGLPGVELAQFYIMLTVVKALMKGYRPFLFYLKYLNILGAYLVFLILWGQINGFNGEANDYFRILKMTLPFLLLYSLPRLFISVEYYWRFFSFVFPVLIAGLIAQVFFLITGTSLAGAVDLTEEQLVEGASFRQFYNVAIVLLALFGSLFFLFLKKYGRLNRLWLYLIIVSAFSIAFLSATRGWILSLGSIIVASFFIIPGLKLSKKIGFITISILVIVLGLNIVVIRNQVLFSTKRLSTIEDLAKGDISAGGTLQRLDIRSPKVINKWKERPVFGWGFSDVARAYSDGHVGNQSLLLVSGIVGFVLMIGFMIYFCVKLLMAYRKAPTSSGWKKTIPVFIIFLTGWFFIHSTSGQHFNYMVVPMQFIPQAVFFSFGALVYNKVKQQSGNVKSI